jgi:hypothetical protein
MWLVSPAKRTDDNWSGIIVLQRNEKVRHKEDSQKSKEDKKKRESKRVENIKKYKKREEQKRRQKGRKKAAILLDTAALQICAFRVDYVTGSLCNRGVRCTLRVPMVTKVALYIPCPVISVPVT